MNPQTKPQAKSQTKANAMNPSTTQTEVKAQSQSDFYARYRDRFYGVLRWPQLDELWQHIKEQKNSQWYIYAIGEAVPEVPATVEQLERFIQQIDALLRKEHVEDYCGVVYADNLTAPSFVKIYDPNNLGVVCGYSNNPPLPGWILSHCQPAELNSHTFISQSRKRWWQRLFSQS